MVAKIKNRMGGCQNLRQSSQFTLIVWFAVWFYALKLRINF